MDELCQNEIIQPPLLSAGLVAPKPRRPNARLLAVTEVKAGDLARFNLNVDRSGGPDACWPWTGYRHPRTKYGRFFFNGHRHAAHRFACSVGHEISLREGMLVLHRCDNPPCCNPKHLWTGTYQDNSDDMIAKNRGRWTSGVEMQKRMKKYAARGRSHSSVTKPVSVPKGIGHGMHKLTNEQVYDIRSSVAAGTFQVTMARKYGVCKQTISNVVHRSLWKHLK